MPCAFVSRQNSDSFKYTINLIKCKFVFSINAFFYQNVGMTPPRGIINMSYVVSSPVSSHIVQNTLVDYSLLHDFMFFNCFIVYDYMF